MRKAGAIAFADVFGVCAEKLDFGPVGSRMVPFGPGDRGRQRDQTGLSGTGCSEERDLQLGADDCR